MSYFDGDDGKRYTPFGAGSGDRIQREFGLPHIVRFPIAEDISQAGDGAQRPAVVCTGWSGMKSERKDCQLILQPSCRTPRFPIPEDISQAGDSAPTECESSSTRKNKSQHTMVCDASSLHLSMPPLSLATGGRPLVIDDPSSETAGAFMELGAAVVREVAKLEAMPRNAVR